MLTDTSKLRYGYTVTELNKTASNHSRLSNQAISAGLDEEQTVAKMGTVDAERKNTSERDLSGELKKHKSEKSFLEQKKELLKQAGFRTGEAASSGKNDKDVVDQVLDAASGKKLTPYVNTTQNADGSAGAHKHAHTGKHDGFDKDCPNCECSTCKNRRYQDGSDDSAVSFQKPTKMKPEQAAYMVKSHEMEHVRREQYKAKQEDRKIISQSVTIMTDICPECGDIYVAGGLTRTFTKYSNPDFLDLFRVGADDMMKSAEGFTASA